MKRESFKNWLINVAGLRESAANSRIGNCSTVENAFGNLDDHYDRDRLSIVLSQLQYSLEDHRNNKPQHENLSIRGDLYTGLATLKQGVRRYFEFKEEEQQEFLFQEINGDLPGNRTIHSPFFSSVPNTNEKVLESHFQKDNTILLLAVNQLQGLSFTIGRYQRGYKWGKKETLELLNDINEYDCHSGLYCLQPIILKPEVSASLRKIELENKECSIYNKNEVIDGQQRTTTLFLLTSYLKHIGLLTDYNGYDISFQTRPKSGKFLSEKLPLLFDLNISSISDEELLKKDYGKIDAANELWREFIKENRQFDNVDVYHFFIVMVYIKKWLGYYLDDAVSSRLFTEKLLHSVRVIWYSLDEAINSNKIIDIFLNNNKGKIKLTSSELIKAVFILSISNNEMQALANLHINRFALEWDNIEKRLQDDSFWYFIQPNDNLYKDGTRIDFLFDLHLNKEDKDDLFAYRYYETAYNQKGHSFDEEWKYILRLFNKLIDWYNHPELYHFVGYLTNSHILSLKSILKTSVGLTKSEINLELRDVIKQHFLKDQVEVEGKKLFVYDLENLHFEKYYKQTKKVLLLHNLMYYVDNMAKHKFPFELFVKEKWSIEHIIPQTPKEIEDFEMYKNWFAEQIKFQGAGEADLALIEKLTKKKTFEELKLDKMLSNDIERLIQTFEDTTHDINNLLLLDRNTNSALQNGFFSEKRQRVLQLDRDGKFDDKPVFIPMETLNAFNKTFSVEVEYKHWTLSDGENYKEAIATRLVDFLPEKPLNNIANG
jgi:hypothetical protein